VTSFLQTVNTAKSFEAAVDAVEEKALEKGLSVVHTCDAGETSEGGGSADPLRVIAVCNLHCVEELLKIDADAALMFPCTIAVYTKQGRTYISALRPAAAAELFHDSCLEEAAAQANTLLLQIVDEARA
jgi:uncharacterized protein (DUF302 family)